MPVHSNAYAMLSLDQKILAVIGKELIKREQTIAVAESVTTGLVQFAIGSAAHAMKFYQGGITTYNIPQKFHHLGVEPIEADKCHAVSESVAVQMALGVSEIFGSQWGIGITGYASPVPESGNKLFAYFAISFQQKVVAQKKLHYRQKPSSATDVQLMYANAVLTALYNLLNSRK